MDIREIALGGAQVSPCVRCGTAGDNDRGLPVAAVDQVVSQMSFAARDGVAGIMLAGAEPFAHPSLVDIIGAARGLGIERIGVQTDGQALALGQNAPGSIGAGVRVFEFVFHGGNPAAHDRLTGRPGSFDALAAGVAAVKRAGSSGDSKVFVGSVIRLCRHNADQLVDAVSAAVELGVRAIRLEVTTGFTPDPKQVHLAHAVATTAGIALFGDGCEEILNGARLYTVSHG